MADVVHVHAYTWMGITHTSRSLEKGEGKEISVGLYMHAKREDVAIAKGLHTVSFGLLDPRMKVFASGRHCGRVFGVM